MITHTHSRHSRHAAGYHGEPSPHGWRLLGISAGYWIIALIALGLCIGIYVISDPVSPDAFDQPGAQVPNHLRSPWGVKNPI